MHQGRHIFFHFLDDCSISMLLTPNLTNLIATVTTTAGMMVVPQASLDQLLKLSAGWTLEAIILIIIASGILVMFAAIAILKVWKNPHLNRCVPAC
jgi:hypothetical protein